MATGFEALVPVFLVILIGWTLRATGTVSDDMWKVLEHVCYYVLFPALMFHKIAGADLAGAPVFAMGAAMLLAIATMLALLLALRIKIMTALTITGASYSSIFQGATRWNTFVALSVIAVILGDDGLTLAAIGMAAMIPALNIANVIVISLNAEGTRPTTRRIVNLVIRNPLVLACLAGIAVNGLGIGLAGVFARTLDLIGTGALGVGLLTVGAALRLGGFAAHGQAVALSSTLRLLLMPVLMFAWTSILGVNGTAQAVAIISGAVPAASASYILARQLGGDAELMASIITAQTIVAVLTLPFVFWLFVAT